MKIRRRKRKEYRRRFQKTLGWKRDFHAYRRRQRKRVGDRIVSGHNSWEPSKNLKSKERHDKLLESCLADESARHEFHIRLSDFQFYLVRDGSKALFLWAVDVYYLNPFPSLTEWLEKICTYPERKQTVILEDDCHLHLFLYIPAVTEDGKAALILDEQIYDEKRDTYYIIADTKTIVREFYKGIMGFDTDADDDSDYESDAQCDIFTSYEDSIDDDDIEYTECKPIRSETVEKYLAENFFQAF